MKRFKKFLKYFGVFMLLAVSIAGFKVANFLLNKTPEEELVEPSGKEESSALTEILDKIMSMDSGEFDINLTVDTGKEEISLDALALVDMGKEQNANNEQTALSLGGMKLSLAGDIAIDGEGALYDISYLGDKIYADLAGIKVKMQTSNLESDIQSLLALSMFERFGLNVSLPEISMDSFDASLLVQLTSSIKEEKSEGQIKVSLNLFGYGDVVMLTDEEYNLKQVTIEELDFDGTKIACDIGVKLNEKIAPIVRPANEEEMLDLSHLTNVAESVSDLIEKGYISGNVDLSLGKEVYSAKYQFSFEDFEKPTLYVETIIAGQKLVVRYEDKKVYVAYDGFKYFVELSNFDLGEMIEKINNVSANFGYELPKLEMKEEFKLSQIVGLLSLVEKFSLTSENISLSLMGAELDVNIVNGEFDNVQLVYGDEISVKAQMNEEIEKEKFDKTEYFSIENLEDKINGVINQVKEKKVATNVKFSSNGETFETTLYLDFQTDLKARVCGEALSYRYDIAYQNNYVYVNFNELKLKYEFEPVDINDILVEIESIAGEYISGFELPKFDIREIESSLENVDFTTLFAFANGIAFEVVKASEEYVEIEVEGIVFKVYLDERIDDIELSYKETTLTLEILPNDFEISHADDYIRINVALGYIPALIDFASAGKYKFATSVVLGDFVVDINGKIDITNGIKAQVEIELENFVFEITYIDEVVYINFNNKTIKGSLEELDGLISRITGDEECEKDDTQTTFDFFEDIIGDENVLNIALKMGFGIILQKDGNSITGLSFIYEDLSIAFELSNFDGEITYQENEQVLNIVELYDFSSVLADFITNDTIAFDIELSLQDFVVSGKAMLKDGKVSAYLETEIMNRTLLLVLKDETIYVDFDGLKITCAINQIGDLIAFVCEYAGIEMPKISGEVENIDVNELISSIVLKLKNDIFTITYEDLILNIDTTKENLNEISASYGDLSVKLIPCEEFKQEISGNYIELYELKDLSKAVYNTLKNMSVSGTIEVTLNLFGEDNLISIDYAIALKDNKVIGCIETEFKGLAINVYIDGNDVYLSVVGLKIHLNLNDIDDLIKWVNETFEANIDTESMNQTFEDLKNMKLDFIASVETIDGMTYVSLTNGTNICVEYDEYVNAVRFDQGGREAILTCTDFSLINLDNLVRGEYRDYSEFTPIIESFYNLVMSSQYDLSGTAQVYKKGALSMDISGDVELDIINGLLAYADITGLGEQITINYQDKKLYFRYAGVDGLKISLGEEAIQEIAAILLSAMGVDTSSIPYLDEILKKEDINTDNLESLMPEIDFGNPLNYLEYISSFEITDSCFTINIKGEKISEYAKGKDVSIKIFYSSDKVTSLAISNLYISSDERFDLNITLNEFTTVTKVEESDKANYIDLTNSKDLIKALANTSVLNDYHINGKVKLNVDIGIEFPMASLNVDARIKREEIETTYVDEATGDVIYKKTNELTGIITIDNYPLIGLVNNANTNGVGGLGGLINIRARKITIILKGAYAYLFTDDESWGAYDRLQRATKVTTAYLLNNIEYYMQYLLGFTDTIQTKINETFEASRNYTGPVKYGDIIKSYSMNDREHTIVLNMAEIAHNGDIGTLEVKLTTINDSTTGGKDFLYRLDVDMKLFDGMLAIATDFSSESDALFLVDIGKEVDLSTCKKMMSDYDFTYKLGVDGEYEKQGNESWKQANTGTSTVTFKLNNGEDDIVMSGAIASAMELPTLARVEYETRDDGYSYKIEYKFLGWFSDEACTSKFESAYYPRYNTTLYAGWEVSAEKRYVTVSFVTNEDSITEPSISGYATEKLTLPNAYSSIENKVNENVSRLRTFLGWFDENGVEYTETNFNKFPSENLTLYAHWLDEATSTYNLTLEYDGKIYNTTVPGEREYDFAIVKSIYTAGVSKVYDFETGNEVTNFEINGNYHWVIKNPFVATVRSYFNTSGKVDSSKTYEAKIGENPLVYNGEQIELQVQSNYTDDLGTYFVEYVFKGYKAIRLDSDSENSTLGELLAPNADGKIITTMPSRDVVYVAEWEATEYVYITFDTTWAKPSSWVDKNSSFSGKVEQLSAPTQIDTIKVQRNVEFDPSKYNSTCKYKYTCVLVPGTYDFFVGTWKTEGGTSCAFSTTPVDAESYTVLTKLNPSEHMTLYAHWDA